MPCIVEQPEMTWESQLEMMLEQACKFLTKQQISSIYGSQNSGWIGACEWYKNHLMLDYNKNYDDENMRKFYEVEANRLGWKLKKIDGGVSID